MASARLTKPTTKAEREHARTRTYGNSYAAAILPRLLDDIEELEAALAPFANYVDTMLTHLMPLRTEELTGIVLTSHVDGHKSVIRIGHLVAAAELYARLESEVKEGRDVGPG